MIFREAQAADIDQMMIVRLSVHENKLSNPHRITKEDYEQYLSERGKGWVCEIDTVITGFAVADLQDRNVWALFIAPMYEKRGIGKKLHNIMLDWYFNKTFHTIWLSTEPASRAEKFYRLSRWTEVGMTESGEVRFEMTFKSWKKISVEQILSGGRT